MSDVTLLSGFPSYYAQRLARRLLTTDPDERLFLLCEGRFQVAAEVFVRELPQQARARVVVLHGEPGAMDLGLPGREYRRLCAEITAIHYLAVPAAPPTQSATSGRPSRRTPPPRHKNDAAAAAILAGTRNLIDLSLESSHLRRLCHHSTTAVSGGRVGVILEDELDLGQRFADAHDEANLHAEVLLRQVAARSTLPLTILRAGPIVGDSGTGEIDRFAGPYSLIRAILRSPLVLTQFLRAPAAGGAPVQLCPIDYLCAAAVALSRDARAAGLSFHITDPAPLSVRALGERVLRHASGQTPRPSAPPKLLRAVLRAPGIQRLARVSFPEEGPSKMTFYNCANTTHLLAGTGIRCPALPGYLPKLLDYMQKAQSSADAAAADREEDEADPLD